MKQHVSAVVTAGLLVATATAQDNLKPDDQAGRINYSLGYQIGEDLRRQGMEINPRTLLQGLETAVSGRTAQLKGQEMQDLLKELKQRIVESEIMTRRAKTESTLQQGNQYLDNNSRQAGVVTTDSGLQYRVIKAGAGKSPISKDRVSIRYRATRTDGRVFDSTDGQQSPPSFRVNELTAGLQEGLQLMKVGARWQLTIPPKLGFRRRGGPMEHEVTIYEVELVAID